MELVEGKHYRVCNDIFSGNDPMVPPVFTDGSIVQILELATVGSHIAKMLLIKGELHPDHIGFYPHLSRMLTAIPEALELGANSAVSGPWAEYDSVCKEIIETIPSS
jgi:hypothetical protein